MRGCCFRESLSSEFDRWLSDSSGATWRCFQAIAVYRAGMTPKERLKAIEADLGALISDIIRSKRSRRKDSLIERGVLVGQLTAAESIIAVVREDMPEDV